MDLPLCLQELLILRNQYFNYVNQNRCRVREINYENNRLMEIKRNILTPFWQPWTDDYYNEEENNKTTSNNNKQLPTTKWKRERRTRPEYSRKSADPKESQNGFHNSEDSSQQPPHQNQREDLVNNAKKSSYSLNSNSPNSNIIINNNNKVSDAPLDMTTRQRGLPPPSYSQAISDPNFRSTYTNSNSRPPPPPICRDELPSGISMCDPIIDEHFRRSLGKDYNTVFSNNNGHLLPKETAAKSAPVKKTTPPPPPPPALVANTNHSNVIELMDNAGLSVDEHFAKALGDTWHKLNTTATNNNNKKETISPNAASATKANESLNPTAVST